MEQSNNFVKEKRVGTFRVARTLPERDFSQVQEMLSETIVIRCEYLYATDQFEYVAYSPHFDVVAEGRITPEYTGTFKRFHSADGDVLDKFVGWKRLD